MAFDINRFQKKYKEVVAENDQLRERIATWAAGKAAEIEAAVIAAATPLRNQVQDLKLQLAHRDRQLQTAETERQLMAEQLVKAEQGAVAQIENIRTLERQVYALQAKLADVQPKIDLAEGKAADLLAELKKHEGKMAEKQRREIAAIENRKALAGVAPAPNRR